MPYTIDQINNNQGQINFLLVSVDQRVIWTLKEILGVLKTVPQLKDVDFTRLENSLKEAKDASNRVADITPPGCVEPPPPPGGGGGGGGQYPL